MRTALVLAPHPDDEAIAAFGLMRHLVRQGTAVRVVVVADGAASHPGSRRWPGRRLVAERRRETLRAMRRIGVCRGAVRFLGWPDGALDAAPPAMCRAVAREVRRMRAPALLVSPVVDDDHADHRAVARAAAIRCPHVRRLGYEVWPVAQRPGPRRMLLLGLATTAAKRHTIRSYRTQAGLIDDDPAGFAMTRAQIAAFSRPVERFREIDR